MGIPKIVSGKPSLLAGQAQTKVADLDTSKGLVFSFKHFDPRQGQDFDTWQAEGLLSDMLQRFREHCRTERFHQCFGEKFKQYTQFPPTSEFKHPSHVPKDAIWHSMHIKGKPCVIGHMIHNVFYVVFLDGEHRFWPSTAKDN